MTRDRAIAEALSDGLNCITTIVAALQADAQAPRLPGPEWETTLHAMEEALDAIASNEVTTSLVVSQEDRDRVRRVRALVSDWTVAGRPPRELGAVAEFVLGSLGH